MKRKTVYEISGSRDGFGPSSLRRFIPKPMMMLAASIIAYIALRIGSIWALHLWGDEVFTYSLSQGPWLSLFKRAGLDMVHPPLFYLVLKLWIYLADSSMAGLRVFTVAISLATIVPLILLGRELGFRTRVIVLALGLMAVNNYLILYSYYLRSYSLLLFFTLCSQVAFVKFLRSSKENERGTLLTLTVINILFVYTHYSAWLVVTAEFLWVAFMERRHLRRIAISSAITLLCFLPWVVIIVYVSTKVPFTFWDKVSWYRPPHLQSLVFLLRCFNGGFESKWLTVAGSAVFLMILLLAVKYRDRESTSSEQVQEASPDPYALLACLSAFPIVVSLTVSYAFTWMWEPRYMIVAIGPYLLLVAACAFRFRSLPARAAALVFLVGWSSVAGFTDNLADALHGPNAPSYWLARDLARTETRTEGPIKIYGLSPYAEQGLRLALNLTGERRFKTIPDWADGPLAEDYSWIALTEHDPIAAARVKQLAADPVYLLGEPIYSGEPPQRHILISVRRR